MDAPTTNSHTALPQGQAGNLRHECSCGASFIQRQGLTRHIRRALNPHSCVSCDFRWVRPYAYRKHIIKNHPDLDPDIVVGKSAESRRPAMPPTKRSAQQPRSLPAVEQGQQMSARFQPYPLAPPLVAGVTSVPQPATFVAHDLQPVHPGLAITMDEHEHAPRSEFRDALDLPAMFPSTEECAELVSDLDDSRQDCQLGLANTFFPRDIFDFGFTDNAVRLPSSSAHPGGSTAAHGSSDLESFIPTPASPAGESVPPYIDLAMLEQYFSGFYLY
jgi:hypothetical protein